MNDRLQISGRGGKVLAMPGFAGGIDRARDESVLPISRAASVSGFRFGDGALKDGYGVEQCELRDTEVKGVWLYRRNGDEILMYADWTGRVMYYRDGVKNVLNGVTVTGKALGVNYRVGDEDVVLICSDRNHMTVWNGADPPYEVADSPFISSMAVHYERLFVTTPTLRDTLLFSDDLDPTNWHISLTEAGRITLADERGALNKVVSYGGYLYVFRDYGISRLTAYGDQRGFSVANLFVSGGRIYADTVCLCGDVILFLAQDGLYSFDGFNARKILKSVSPLFCPDTSACAAYYGGSYYLSALSADGSRILMVYELGGSYSLTAGIGITAMFSVGKVMCLCDGMVGEITPCGSFFGSGFTKRWISPYGDLGTDKLKLVKEISLISRGNLTVKVRADGRQRNFSLVGSPFLRGIKVNMTGRLFSFALETGGNGVYVGRPYIRYYTF